MYANMNILLNTCMHDLPFMDNLYTQDFNPVSINNLFKSGYQRQSCIHGNTSEINDSVLYYMWQSLVKIKHYSIAYFDHITMFEAL